jgi:hypothetical protein
MLNDRDPLRASVMSAIHIIDRQRREGRAQEGRAQKCRAFAEGV